MCLPKWTAVMCYCIFSSVVVFLDIDKFLTNWRLIKKIFCCLFFLATISYGCGYCEKWWHIIKPIDLNKKRHPHFVLKISCRRISLAFFRPSQQVSNGEVSARLSTDINGQWIRAHLCPTSNCVFSILLFYSAFILTFVEVDTGNSCISS